MFGLGKRSLNSSITPIHLCLLILLIQQFLLVRSFRLSTSDLDQNELDDVRRGIIRRLAFVNSEESSGDDDTQVPRFQRRFCCMNPLSGRKRSLRDPARKQIRI